MSPLEARAGQAGCLSGGQASKKARRGGCGQNISSSHTHTLSIERAPGEGWATLPPITHARAIDWGAPAAAAC
jgi:hypothetical protein